MPMTKEVFGIQVDPVLSYLERSGVDDLFQAAVESDHHIVIYGSSKQGKTSLRQKRIAPTQGMVVHCDPTMTTESIYSSILRQADIKIQTLESTDFTLSGKMSTKVGFKAILPWIGGVKTDAGVEAGAEQQTELTEEFVSFDFGEAQSVGEILKKISFSKFVILENFHYLKPEVQRKLAFDLKTFHEIKIRFIITGIWWEANYLIVHNADLTDRLVEVPVEPWTEEDFRRVAQVGSDLLQLTIAPNILEDFIQNSFGNIGMFQEFLKEFCLLNGVNATVNGWVLDKIEVKNEVFRKKLEIQRGQLLKVLQTIASRSRMRSEVEDPLFLPYYLTIVICKGPLDVLIAGMDKSRLLQLIREVHHRTEKETVRIGDITNLMQRLPALQADITPFLYFNTMNRHLEIVDKRHLFVLTKINRDELAEDIPFPRE